MAVGGSGGGPSGAIRAGAAFIELMTKDNALIRGLERAKARVSAFGSSMVGIGARLGGLGAVVFGPLMASFKSYLDDSSNLVDIADRLGTSVDVVEKLSYVWELAGAEIEDVEKGLLNMQKTLAAAAEGGEEAAGALGRLGLSIDDLTGLSLDEQAMKIADGFGEIEDAAQRTDLVFKIFGKSGAKLLPALKEGGDAFRDSIKEAMDSGFIKGDAGARAAEEIGDQFTRLGMITKNVFKAIAPMLIPLFKDMGEWVTSIAKGVTTAKKALAEWAPLIQLGFKIAAGMVAAGAAMSALGALIMLGAKSFGILTFAVKAVGVAFQVLYFAVTLIPRAILAVSAAISGMMAMAQAIPAAMSFLVSLPGLLASGFSAALTAVAALNPITLAFAAAFAVAAGIAAYVAYQLWPAFKDGFKSAYDAILPGLKQIGETFAQAFGGITDALKSGDLKTAGEIAITALQIAWEIGLDSMMKSWDAFLITFSNKAGKIIKEFTGGLIDIGVSDEDIKKLQDEIDRGQKLDAERRAMGIAVENDDRNARIDELRAKLTDLTARAAAAKAGADDPAGAVRAGDGATGEMWKRIREIGEQASAAGTRTFSAAGTFTARNAGQALGATTMIDKLEKIRKANIDQNENLIDIRKAIEGQEGAVIT